MTHSSAGPSNRPFRLRRSSLAVPGSAQRMHEKAAAIEADEVFFDLEDSVAPSEKARARDLVVESLNTIDYGDKTVVVRINDVSTPYCYQDIIQVVSGAGGRLDCLMVPKVEDASQLGFVDHLLDQLEGDLRLERRIGIEALIETGSGSVNLREISRTTSRLESLIFGPGDYAASIGVSQLQIGMVDEDYPGHQWHYILSQVVAHAQAAACDAIDGPFGDFNDPDGYRESAGRALLLGCVGKWCIHPSQVPLANSIFTPPPSQIEAAARLLAAYDEALADGRGAASHDGRLIDEASRKVASRILAMASAAGIDVE